MIPSAPAKLLEGKRGHAAFAPGSDKRGEGMRPRLPCGRKRRACRPYWERNARTRWFASPSDSPHVLEPPNWKLRFDAVESDWMTSGLSSRR
jgi:hypothetical protein